MFDTKRFILCVRSYPCLWRTSDEIYKDKRLRTQAWQLIGVDIYPDWPTIDAERRLQRVKEMQKKWKNIRDRYIKDTKLLSSARSVSNKRKAKKYPFFEMLNFLRSTITVRPKRTARGYEEQHVGDAEMLETAEEAAEETGGEGGAKSTAIEIKQEDIRESPEMILNVESSQPFGIAETSGQFPFDEQMDADKAFFYSLLPIVRKLDDAQKMDMRIEILNVIKDIQRR